MQGKKKARERPAEARLLAQIAADGFLYRVFGHGRDSFRRPCGAVLDAGLCRRAIREGKIVGSGDGLLPGHDQTYRLKAAQKRAGRRGDGAAI